MGTVTTVVTPEYKPASGTMKALAWFGPGDVRLVDAPIPDIIQDDDVILRVTGTTICGSDLHLSAPFCNAYIHLLTFMVRQVPRRDSRHAEGRYHGS